ncbi:MAG: hypothetical protein ACK56F_16220, partial [bacterium]
MPLHQEEVEHVKINTETGAVATGAPSPPPSVAPVAVYPGRDWIGGKSPRMLANRWRPPLCANLRATIGESGDSEVINLPAPSRHR